MNIYVGNLAYSVTEDELRDAFEQLPERDDKTHLHFVSASQVP